MKKMRKIIAIVLVLVMALNFNVISFAGTGNDFVYEGKVYKIIEDNESKLIVETENENFVVRASLDYTTREVLLDVIGLQETETAIATLNESEYTVTYRVSTPEDSENGISGYIFENQTNGEMYNGAMISTMSSITIPLWMGIGQAAINALLALGKAIIVGSVAWVAVEEIITTIETSDEDYFEARIDNASDCVYVGDSISRSQALTRIKLNNELYGVFCRTERLAYNLADVYSKTDEGPVYHANCDKVGYWPHYHSTKSYQAVHIWFPGV